MAKASTYTRRSTTHQNHGFSPSSSWSLHRSANEFSNAKTLAPERTTEFDWPQHWERYRGRMFRYVDENGEGKISPSELESCMRTIGEELMEEDAEAVVESADSDGDGLLGFEDIARLMAEGEGEEERKRSLREAFGVYAAEEGGCITSRSLRRTLARLGEVKTLEDRRLIIQRFDLNGDEVISLKCFSIMKNTFICRSSRREGTGIPKLVCK
ncbi:unnamed protein product [Spirodela intermedia]|uniref:EF-hand domain-containing protein n=1 Tax=Spirodela intermedia TaxID=51605 RepID=A0A7I8LCV5_SPIIN|nr:unnamed protein product [Spirodela intermedia]